MGFEQLLASLEEKGKTQEREIISGAQAEARKIQSQAEAEVKAIMEKAKTAGQVDGNEQKAEMYAAARLKAKRIIAEARESTVNDSLLQLENQLESVVHSREYSQLLVQLSRSGAKSIGGKVVVKCNREDEKALKAGGYEVQVIKCTGGAIIESADGKIKVNNTLENLLANFTPQLKQKAYEELFPRRKSAEIKTPAITQAKLSQQLKPIQSKQQNKPASKKMKTKKQKR